MSQRFVVTENKRTIRINRETGEGTKEIRRERLGIYNRKGYDSGEG